MSYATNALILIRLDARAGEWVDVHDLAQHMQAPDMVVVHALEEMAKADGNGVQIRYVAGRPVSACTCSRKKVVAPCA